MGMTNRLPRITRLPAWSHSVICAEMVGSFEMRDSI